MNHRVALVLLLFVLACSESDGSSSGSRGDLEGSAESLTIPISGEFGEPPEETRTVPLPGVPTELGGVLDLYPFRPLAALPDGRLVAGLDPNVELLGVMTLALIEEDGTFETIEIELSVASDDATVAQVHPKALVAAPTGNIYVSAILAEGYDNDPVIVELDIEAREEVAAYRYVGTSSVDVFKDVAITGDGGVIAVGTLASLAETGGAWVVKLDSALEEEWAITYAMSSRTEGPPGTRNFFVADSTAVEVEVLDDGYLVHGTITHGWLYDCGAGNAASCTEYDSEQLVLRLDGAGNVVSSRELGWSIERDDFARSLTRTAGGRFVITGRVGDVTASTDVLFATLTDGLTVSSVRSIEGSGADYVLSSEALPDGGSVHCIYTESYGSGRAHLLVALDENGSLRWSTPLSTVPSRYVGARCQVEALASGGLVAVALDGDDAYLSWLE